MKRVLSGIQPTGTPHIGNYFGMMKPCIEMQDQAECYYFIADYHALTQTPEPSLLQEQIRNVALDFLACGLDPDKVVFFRQSDVPEVTELTWILNCLTPLGLLERCHSYKDKVAKGIAPNTGLFTYPVLMAADILLYDSQIVPVGKDQKQHLEVTRDLALRFNNRYGNTFVVPEPLIREEVAVIPGTDGQKMSKSYDNIIPLFAPKKAIRKRVMSIVTDSTPLEEPKDPENCNVIKLYRLFASDDELQAMVDNYRRGNYGYGHAKQALFEKIWDYFEPFRQRREALAADPKTLDDILARGKEKARQKAREVIDRVRRHVGLQ
ncbi:MAG: tryptophan--tRNA ligase [Lentisphaerae bacterium]|nr:MAG: tryptophan--tRNA ligase [Lentisphaerota bacterium]